MSKYNNIRSKLYRLGGKIPIYLFGNSVQYLPVVPQLPSLQLPSSITSNYDPTTLEGKLNLQNLRWLMQLQLNSSYFGEGGLDRLKADFNRLYFGPSLQERATESIMQKVNNSTSTDTNTDADSDPKTGGDNKVGSGPAIAGMVMGTAGALNSSLTSGKNFGEQSLAIDSTVNALSSAASLFGPYGVMAAGILQAANGLSKAGGKTVSGFDVDINNSGYGDLGHYESKANRNWAAALLPGFGGLFGDGKKIQLQLDRRNQAARMAMDAAAVADNSRFELEARSNNVQNVMQNNIIALNGGLNTDLLAG